jgi:hypothetical protein
VAALTDTERQDPVTVVLEQGVPVRVDWNGVRFYADAPPEPRGRVAVTAPDQRPDPRTVTGWRISATSVAGDSRRFEVISAGGGRWCVTRVDT